MVHILRLLPSVLGSWKDYSERYCIPYETDYGVAYRSKNLDELGRIARENFMVRRKLEDILGPTSRDGSLSGPY